MLIPTGKHKGRALEELSENSLIAMYGSWLGFEKKRASAFFLEIYKEIERRNFQDRVPPPTYRKPPTDTPRQPRQPKPKKGKNKHRNSDAANCGCGNGVKLAVFVTEKGEQFCDIECTACKASFGRVKYANALGMKRKGELYFIEPAKQSKSDQRKVYYRQDRAEEGETTQEYLELMSNIL